MSVVYTTCHAYASPPSCAYDLLLQTVPIQVVHFIASFYPSIAVSWEVSDSGAFYTCGQKGEAFINPNSSLVGNTFRRVYNIEPVALGFPSVQAIYLDE